MKFDWPVQGTITRGFYFTSPIYVGGMHGAIDIAAPSGTPVTPVATGVVRGDAWDPYSGYFVVLAHLYGWYTTYRHLRRDSPLVLGDVVRPGQVLGEVGTTGLSPGPHLHFDLWRRDDLGGGFRKCEWYAYDATDYLGGDLVLTKEEVRDIVAEEMQARLGGINVNPKTDRGKVYVWSTFERVMDAVHQHIVGKASGGKYQDHH